MQDLANQSVCSDLTMIIIINVIGPGAHSRNSYLEISGAGTNSWKASRLAWNDGLTCELEPLGLSRHLAIARLSAAPCTTWVMERVERIEGYEIELLRLGDARTENPASRAA